MWIINTNIDENGDCRTRSVKLPGMAEPVSFEKNPRQVSGEIGRLLVERCPKVEEYSASDNADE